MSPVPGFETITYSSDAGVAWVTLNRPDSLNSFNARMQHELRTVWRWLRKDDTVNAVVLTGAGDKAFCSGIDRYEVLGPGKEANEALAVSDGDGPDPDAGPEPVHTGPLSTPFMFDDPGEYLGPKSNGLWKPVIAAVNGVACGGAFYILGEVDVMIAAEHATFFDPHVTSGMAAGYEPLQMLPKMPFGEIVRMTLLGGAERMSARRAYEIGLVSEVCPLAELHDRAAWVAGEIAKSPPVAVQATLRALWTGRELTRRQALDMAWAIIALGNDPESLAAGQRALAAGERPVPRIR